MQQRSGVEKRQLKGVMKQEARKRCTGEVGKEEWDLTETAAEQEPPFACSPHASRRSVQKTTALKSQRSASSAVRIRPPCSPPSLRPPFRSWAAAARLASAVGS